MIIVTTTNLTINIRKEEYNKNLQQLGQANERSILTLEPAL